ncbi:hypothetical protein [Lysinibacillus sp. fls2-241-R2A-57]|uniref:hypothetical protein n=1 Tax=Lysinibacillus sp. fls2-241-R2A-57 TaxID=3040292 RepID=UPI0025567E6A|nr:hypothetical protein [Lysinibacillus sp. fls2-241-R2A-57]
MLSIFKKKPGGIIRHLALEDFYSTLSESEIEEIKDALGHPYQLTTGKPYRRDDLDKGDRTYVGDRWKFLWSMSQGSNSDLKRKLLLESIKYTNNDVDRYFSLRDLAELAYKEGDYVACERYALVVLPMIKTIKEDRIFNGAQDLFPFKRLAILYEKQGRVQDAISVAEEALIYNLNDGTKGGYEGRIEKLKRKANNMK